MDMTTEAKVNLEVFQKEKLPLYHGPLVTIKLKSEGTQSPATDTEFQVFKGLLCAQSPVFDNMLNGNFKEAHEQIIELEEMEDVVTARGLGYFINWLYLDVIGDERESIGVAVELARFADLYQVTVLETRVEKYIRDLIRKSTSRRDTSTDRNTRRLESEHIISALNLPKENPVRRLLAQASVEGYLRGFSWRFNELMVRYPEYAADVYREGRKCFRRLDGRPTFDDPIRNVRLRALPRRVW